MTLCPGVLDSVVFRRGGDPCVFYNPSLAGKFVHMFQSWAMPTYSRGNSGQLPPLLTFQNVNGDV